MALPNGSGGYQVGDGNLGEPLFFMQSAPTALTLVGAGQVDNGTSGHFRARKTGVGTWTCYRVS